MDGTQSNFTFAFFMGNPGTSTLTLYMDPQFSLGPPRLPVTTYKSHKSSPPKQTEVTIGNGIGMLCLSFQSCSKTSTLEP